MKYETIQIHKTDLKKLMKQKGIKNFKQLAKVAGVNEEHIYKCHKGYRTMGFKTWDKIKVCL